MRKILWLPAVFLMLATMATGQQPWVNGQTVSQLMSDDLDVAILLRYQGASASATYEIDANGDILLKHGVLSSEAADTTVGCPTATGTIDVSNAACDTVGEAVDAINASANWVAVPLDSLRSDTIGTTITLLDEGPLNAQDVDGVKLKWDTSLKFDMTAAVTDRRTMRYYVNDAGTRIRRPFEDQRAIAHKISALSTFGSGTSTIEVWSVQMVDGREVATPIWQEAGGATTVVKVITETPYGFIGRMGEKLVVRLNNSAAMASAHVKVYGMEWTYRSQ